MLQELTQIDLLKNTDWTRVQNVFGTLWTKIDAGEFNDRTTFEPAYNSTVYSLGNYGSVNESFGLTGGVAWRTWSGSLLEQCIPWSQPLKEKIKALGLNFVTYSYLRHSSPINEHIDGKTAKEGKRGHCNINFLLKCDDPYAYTWVSDGSTTLSYPSDPNRAWLLQTDIPHAVVNTGVRESFQIKLDSPYHEVAEVLKQNPTLLQQL